MENDMSDKVTLDRIDFEKLKEQATAERAECLRQYGTAALGAVDSTLRTHHVIAIASILLISFGVKMFFLSAPTADANTLAVPRASMNVLQMHADHPNKNNLPPQQINDMTFVEPLP
jgi:hypothetical protein